MLIYHVGSMMLELQSIQYTFNFYFFEFVLYLVCISNFGVYNYIKLLLNFGVYDVLHLSRVTLVPFLEVYVNVHIHGGF